LLTGVEALRFVPSQAKYWEKEEMNVMRSVVDHCSDFALFCDKFVESSLKHWGLLLFENNSVHVHSKNTN
jgi:hypothetical protein